MRVLIAGDICAEPADAVFVFNLDMLNMFKGFIAVDPHRQLVEP